MRYSLAYSVHSSLSPNCSLYLLKKTPRRGGGVTAAAIRAKSSTGDSTRRWKASSAGNGMTIPYLDVTLEDSDDVAPSSTNVNVSMLFAV